MDHQHGPECLYRLKQLEAARRRQSRLNVALGVTILAAVVGGLAVPEDPELRAQRFVVVDEEGTQRAMLGLRDGRIALLFEDEEGGIQAGFGLSNGADGTLVPEGHPELFLGPPGNPFAQLAIQADPMEEDEKEATFVLGRLDPEQGVVLHSTSGPDGASLSMMCLGTGGPWGVSQRLSLVATRSAGALIEIRDSRGTLQFTTDEEQVEFDGSSHFPVSGEEAARTAVSARPSPRFVECTGRGVNDETLRILSTGRGFVEIALRKCPEVTEQGLRYLAQVKGLRHLHMTGCDGLAEADFSHLARARDLSSLDLVGIDLGAEQVRSLASLTQLKELGLFPGYGQAPVTLEEESSLLALGALTGLERLVVSAFGPLRDDTITALRDALPDTEISFGP